MEQLLLIAPVVLPLLAAGIAALGHRRPWLQRAVGAMALLGVICAGVLLTVQSVRGPVVRTVLGAEQPLLGIAVTADPLGAALVAATGLLGAAVLATVVATREDEQRDGYLHPLALVLVAGTCGSFITGDLFNLFVFFELALIASYVLLTLRGGETRLRAAAVYVPVNLVGTLLLLAGIAGVYAATGTVNLAALARLDVATSGGLPGATLVVTAFALKAALLPFSAWIVVGYPAAERTTMALFAGTLTTIGVVALYRVVLLSFDGAAVLRTGVLVVAVVTVVSASVAAIAMVDHGRVLALMIATQVGFMVLGFGLGTRAAVMAGVFFILQDVLVKTGAVLAYGMLRAGAAPGGHPTVLSAASFTLLALSLVGIPPLAGFVGKTLLVAAAFEAGSHLVAAAALLGSIATLAALLPLWRRAVANPRRAGTGGDRPRGRAVPAAAVAAMAVGVGIAPGWLLTIAGSAADVLLDPSGYASQVLGP